MATTRSNTMRLRTSNRENTAISKSNIDANPVSRSALNEIGNKVSCITLENIKRKEITKKGSLRQRAAVPKTTIVKQELTQPQPPPKTENESKSQSSPMEVCETEPRIDMANVVDIDVDDHENPQLVSEYVNDIYNYLRELEKTYTVRRNYLQGQEITGKMRAILIDWLCQVHHRFRLLQETLYLTVSVLDRFLQINPVIRSKLQLVGVTSMLIASKYEEMYAPEVSDFVYITDNAYTRADIRQMEMLILKTLDFKLGKPLCLHFLRRNSKAGQVDANTHTLAKYLMELTIVEYDMVNIHPSLLAAAALCLSLHLISNTEWNDTLAYYSTYTKSELADIIRKLAKLVLKAETSKLTAIRTKYQGSKFFKISTIPELKGDAIRKVAEN
ncbi:G2/mitotic-specific cyclin-B [Octopus sinensis]|uniref:G2/mitotic-specific cyclin-B n=1 Tax=Octopus sinensis TaxID=2607531 RepID=A0A6P7T8F8_9MOLL|nr:G2/mitotic-specific cyclin-B [Octopus sinensis]